jgi:hypothetical protein
VIRKLFLCMEYIYFSGLVPSPKCTFLRPCKNAKNPYKHPNALASATCFDSNFFENIHINILYNVQFVLRHKLLREYLN